MASRGLKLIGYGFTLLLVVGVAVAAWQWKPIQAHLTAGKLRSATSADERAAHARQLLTSGEAGIARLIDVFRTGTPDDCDAVAEVLSAELSDRTADDPTFAAVCRPLLAACHAFNDAGTAATVGLVPVLLRCGEPDASERCREIVRAGLTGGNKTTAVRLAVGLGLKGEVVPLLDDPDAEVRRAAMAAVGPAGVGAPAVETEDLFRWLNDPDAQVRVLCEAALSTRGLEPDQIAAGRRLTHPEAGERLKLVLDLERNRAAFRDPSPWLERLSRDPDPAVRAGAARVGYESRLEFGGWLDRLTADPDATVRRIATYHKRRADEVRQAGARE
ncbi:MAG: hypothetical protein MUF18_10895 [Fimbriiglobus sp.]|jgi:hypothetical protein|nr:hypothetical protein [Fimbriiglobus sp.]